jgi:hypothetical protein
MAAGEVWGIAPGRSWGRAKAWRRGNTRRRDSRDSFARENSQNFQELDFVLRIDPFACQIYSDFHSSTHFDTEKEKTRNS